jgi:hypothetical protein
MATSGQVGNCGVSCGAGDSFVQPGYTGTFSFIDTATVPGANLLSGTFAVTGSPSTTGAQFSSRQVFVAVLFCAAAAGQTRPAAVEPPSVAATLSAPAGEGARVGADRCRACHKSEFGQYAKTRHATVSASRNGPAMECETCHGGGKAHADAEEAAHGDDAKTTVANRLIFAFRANPKQNADRCQQCHQSSVEQAKFGHSTHANHGVSCNDCHATHLVAAEPAPSRPQAAFFSSPRLADENRRLNSSLLKKSQPELC